MGKKTSESVEDLLYDIRWELQHQRRVTEALRIVAAKPTITAMRDFMRDRQYGFRETVERLASDRLSFARFGDGELKMMLRADYNLRFQRNSEAIQQSLEAALTERSIPDLLVGLPHAYADAHWTGVWVDIWDELARLLPDDQAYGNSHVTRPIFFQMLGAEGVELWRRVWAGHDVCVITGKDSRFRLLPALFDTVASIHLLESVPVDAFVEVDRLVDRAIDQPDNLLFLVALGPAGTVLTHRLANAGRRAIDIGHISDSYENVFEGGSWPEAKSAIVTSPPNH